MGALVSCIVPVYNGERFLAEAIESVCAQTYGPLEIIIADDGSTDGTPDVVRRYAPAARYLRQENRGAAAARNLGLEAATGEYVAFLDADDLWLPEKIERQAACFEAQPGLEVCLTKFRNFWAEELAEEGRRMADRPLAQPMTGFAPPTLLARRSVFERVGPFDPARRYGENMDWFLRAADLGVVMHLLPEALVRRRIHRGNITRTDETESRDAFLLFVKQMLDRRRKGAAAGSRGYRFADLVTVPSADGTRRASCRDRLVSCIVPVHNGERFLKAAIDSILAQTHRELDVIVVDDGSTDGTAAAALSYGQRVRCFRQENAGPAAARNRGVAEARGAFLAFLDADDTWAPTKIAAQLERLDAEPDLGICLCHIRNVWEAEVADEAERLQGHRRSRPVPGYSTVALTARASVFDVVGPFDTKLGHTDDADWFVRARAAGVKTAMLADVLVYRRMHLGNRSRRRAADSRDEYLRLAKAAIDRRRAERGGGKP